MILQELRVKNPGLPLYGTDSREFAEYGRRVTDMHVGEIIEAAKDIPFPAQGSAYEASVPSLEALSGADEIRKRCFGELPIQVGYCYGYNRILNAWEWHSSSEINIAVTDLVLILAKRSRLKDGRINSSEAEAFLLRAGETVEIYATSLHFCPCQVEIEGFGCVVALPAGTNLPLEEPAEEPLLFRKNKWLIAHEENQGLIGRGAVPGIYGVNFEIQYA